MLTDRKDMSIEENCDEMSRESEENIGFEKAGSEKPGDWRIFASSSLLIQYTSRISTVHFKRRESPNKWFSFILNLK